MISQVLLAVFAAWLAVVAAWLVAVAAVRLYPL